MAGKAIIDDMHYPPVLTKRDFVRRFLAGEFGNRTPTWDTLEDFHRSGYSGLIHVRNRIAGGPTYYDVKPCNVDVVWRNALNRGARPESLYLAAMCPTERTTIQGEIQQTPKGLGLYYTTVAKPMRQALAEWSEEVYGMVAVALLRRYMCANSYEWLQVLLDRYPGHVIEFTSFSINFGTLPNYNTVIWEVRGGY